ncbi:hypothetical protein B0O79_2456 [Flavobacteriaceae bacterium MAR_2009_75]|nr:hypothetical protein B0O79_2456 [Flavobacteriaceae bacterium MAR_2009_75]
MKVKNSFSALYTGAGLFLAYEIPKKSMKCTKILVDNAKKLKYESN